MTGGPLTINLASPCWLWMRGKTGKGYGAIWVHGRLMDAHRYMWLVMRGPIPAGLEVDHLCRVRHCVNPQHMELVTKRENILRGNGLAAQNARKTHCAKGHPLTGGNLYVDPRGGRRCVACRKIETASHRVGRVRVTHCKHGHSLADAWIDKHGHRHCRGCWATKNQRQRLTPRVRQVVS